MNNYKDFATELALKAGTIIQENFVKGVQREWKEDDTPITIVDKEINTLVLNTIKETYPDHSILSEEGSDLTESEYVWVCDPIDGTVPFSHGLPISTFTLSLTQKGTVILAVINDPFMERLVVAEKGKGAFLNGNQLKVSTSSSIKNTVIDIETWNKSHYDLTPLFAPLTHQGVMLTILRSSVYAGMLIGMGELSAIIFAGRTAWDGAAVKLVVEEAGGVVTDLFGNDQLYNTDINGYVASNGKIHQDLIDIIKHQIKPITK